MAPSTTFLPQLEGMSGHRLFVVDRKAGGLTDARHIYHIMDFVELQFVKMSPRAVVPTKATKYSIGLDLHSPDN